MRKKYYEISAILFGIAIGCRANFAAFVYVAILSSWLVDRIRIEKIIISLFIVTLIGGLFYLPIFFQSKLSLAFISNTGGPDLILGELLPRFVFKIYKRRIM